MGDGTRYRAFISYARADEREAAWLQRMLEGFRVPGERSSGRPLSPVFRDRSDLSSAEHLGQAIDAALAASDALVVVCSPAAAASRWVDAEIREYRRLGQGPVFCYVVDGDPGAGPAAADTCFPAVLRSDADDVLGQSLPLAADARPQADGRRDAALRIAAALLDVPYDRLRLRHQRRQTRRAVAVASVATVALGISLLLALFAFDARRESDLRRGQAEELIAFMLGDLRDRLEPVGRLDVLDAVGDAALDYFATLDDAALEEGSVLARARTLRQIGEVRVAQGRAKEGQDAFMEAFRALAREDTALADRRDADQLFELGQIHFWIADAYFVRSEPDLALEHIGRYRAISERLVELDPDSELFSTELMYAESSLGTLAMEAGDIPSARAHFERAEAVSRRLVRDRSTPEALLELADTVSWLARIDAEQGDLSAAAAGYEEQVRILESAQSPEPWPALDYASARALGLLAEIHAWRGEAPAAIRRGGDSMRVMATLLDHDPENVEWRIEHANAAAQLAHYRLNGEELAPAAVIALLDGLESELASVPDSRWRARALAKLHMHRAWALLVQGRSDAAVRAATRGVETLAPYVEAGRPGGNSTLLARGHLIRVAAIARAGDPDRAARDAGAALVDLGSAERQPYATRRWMSELVRRANPTPRSPPQPVEERFRDPVFTALLAPDRNASGHRR